MEAATVFLADAEATQAVGRGLVGQWLKQAELSTPPPILLLQGDLGAGKTSLVQGIATALGIVEAVTSPTFALAQHYKGHLNNRETALVHLDLYRLDQRYAADELFAQEEEEAIAMGALMAVEWSERLSFTPQGAWLIELKLADWHNPESGRIARISTNQQSLI